MLPVGADSTSSPLGHKRQTGARSCSGARARPSGNLCWPADDADDRSQVDATASADVEACVEQVVAEFGRVHGAANCVGKRNIRMLSLVSFPSWPWQRRQSHSGHVLSCNSVGCRCAGGAVERTSLLTMTMRAKLTTESCPRRPFPALALLLYGGGKHGEGSFLLVGGGVHRPAQPRGYRRGQGWRGGACPISRCILLPRRMRVARWSCARVTSGLVTLLPRAAHARSSAPPCRAHVLTCGWRAGMLVC